MNLCSVSPSDGEAWAGFYQRLVGANLATDDLGAPDQTFYRVESENGRVLGWAGLHRLGETILLRSVVAAERGRGHGREIVEAVLASKEARGATAAWLLTTDMAGFFGRLGFTPIDRSAAPAMIAATSQFTSLCPSSATLMRISLPD